MQPPESMVKESLLRDAQSVTLQLSSALEDALTRGPRLDPDTALQLAAAIRSAQIELNMYCHEAAGLVCQDAGIDF